VVAGAAVVAVLLALLPHAASTPAPATPAAPASRLRRETMVKPTSLGLGDFSEW
jgi:hypothetical protein